MISRIDHISIAVRDYERACNFFKGIFGAITGSHAEDTSMKYHWEILSIGDLSRLELLTPTGDGSFLDNFLQQRDGGVHHITFETSDISRAKKILGKNGIPFFGYNEYPGGIWKELFIHPRDAFGVLIQIAEFNPDDWLPDSAKSPDGKRWSVKKNRNAYNLTLSHPGGGKVNITLSRNELIELTETLKNAL